MSKTLKLSVIAILAIAILLLCGSVVNAASINYNAGDHGSGTMVSTPLTVHMPSYYGQQPYADANLAPFGFTANDGYEFSHWQVNGQPKQPGNPVSTSNGQWGYGGSWTPNNITATAIYVEKPDITLNVIDISKDPDVTLSSETFKTSYNKPLASKAVVIPDGYTYLGTSIQVGEEEAAARGPITNLSQITDPITADTTINVMVAKNPTISVTVKDTEGNKIGETEQTVINYHGDFESEEPIVAPKNYKLVNVTVDGVETDLNDDGKLELTWVETDKEVIINVIELHNVTTFVAEGEGEISDSEIVEHGDEFYLTILPKLGYMLKEITVNGTPVEPDEGILNIILAYTIESVKQDYDIKVYFEKIPFTLIVEGTDGATVDPVGATTVLYGNDQEIYIKANRGYKLVSVTVNNKEQTLPLDGDKVVLKNVKKDMVVKVKVEKETYEVVEGAEQTFDGKSDLVVKFSGDLDLFVKLYINGKEVDESNYTKESGSTIIALKADYLNTLENGTYTLTAEYSNGNTAETTFTINKAKEANPKTGDIVVIAMIVLVVSGLGIAITSRKRK